MKLLTAPASPYSRKVKVLLYETGLNDRVELVQVKTSPVAVDPKVQAANPLGRIPCLLREEGPAIYDSRVICRYLDAQAGGGFYPEPTLWEVLTLEAMADGILDSALSMVYERRLRPDEAQSQAWLDAQSSKVNQGLSALNSDWRSFLEMPITAGHIAVGCALGYLDFRLSAQNWRDGNQPLAHWYESFSARESMRNTEPYDPH